MEGQDPESKIARSDVEDEHRLDRPPTDYHEDPRGAGVGAYSGSDHGRSDPAEEQRRREARAPISQGGAGGPGEAEQLGGGTGERPAYGSPDSGFGRVGRSNNNPPSQGPLADRDELKGERDRDD